MDHGIDAFCAFTTGVAVTVTADPELRDPMLMLVGTPVAPLFQAAFGSGTRS